MHKLIVKPFAEEDALKAAAWYNNKSEGLGNEFLLALDAKINEIQRNPNHFQVVYKNIRRALTNRFPFGIFFIVESDAIYILAILHTSRNPKIWKDRE
jgi:plasmid stabilization system protein ParE